MCVLFIYFVSLTNSYGWRIEWTSLAWPGYLAVFQLILQHKNKNDTKITMCTNCVLASDSKLLNNQITLWCENVCVCVCAHEKQRKIKMVNNKQELIYIHDGLVFFAVRIHVTCSVYIVHIHKKKSWIAIILYTSNCGWIQWKHAVLNASIVSTSDHLVFVRYTKFMLTSTSIIIDLT